MNRTVLAARNLTRNKTRVGLTILGVAVAVVVFLFLRTVVWAWTYSKEAGAKDRVATRHKVSFVLQLPKHYIDKIRALPGVKGATWANWFGGKDPKNENHFFATLAVDPPTFLDVYKECVVTPEAAARWKADRQGALVGDVLAKTMGLKEGATVTLKGTIYPGEWQFHVSGIYHSTAKSLDRSQFLFHWNYLNDAAPGRIKDKIGWIITRIDDPAKSAATTAAIDKMFEDSDIQTLSMSEKALNNSFIAMFSAIIWALNVVSIVILAIMLLILGNTIAMGVRERTYEYGVLRAIGFRPGHIASFVVGEGLFIGILGGLLGLALALPLVGGFGRFVEESEMAGFFPFFRLQPVAAAAGMLLAAGLGAVASVIPAWRAARLTVTDSLRRVG